MWADSEGSPNRASAPSTGPSSKASELDALFTVLSRIQQDQTQRDHFNEVITATDVVTIAADLGFHVQAPTLLGLLERCNEAPLARQGLMNETLIRLHLQRERLQAPSPRPMRGMHVGRDRRWFSTPTGWDPGVGLLTLPIP